MPVEIKELIVRTNITTQSENQPTDERLSPLVKRRLIDACVKKVLETLNKKGER